MDRTEISARVKRYDEAFAAANSAAARCDGAGVAANLLQPHVASGLAYRLKKHLDEKKMYAVNQDDVELVIAEAMTAVYTLVMSGTPPRDVGNYLFVTARNKTYAIYTIRRRTSIVDVEAAARRPSDDPQDTPLEDSLTVLEARQRAYLRIIREKIIPQLGKENVRKVMDYIFEAVEKGLSADHAEIADALGVSADHVRTWKSRGFARLRARLEAEGLLDPERRDELIALSGDGDAELADRQDTDPS